MSVHVCEEGHARDLDMPSTNLPPHFYTYGSATCKFFRDSDAPVVFLRRNPRPGAPQIYPCSFLRTRVEQCTFFFVLFCFVLFRTYVHGKQRLAQFYHKIHYGSPVAGVSTYRSRILLSVSACLRRGSHPGPRYCIYQPSITLIHICYGHMQVFQ